MNNHKNKNSAHMKKVLVVEDDPFLSEMICKKLRKAKFEVKDVIDGETAIEIINEFQPDLVLLDIILPGMNGYEVLKRIKGSEETKKISVIAFSNLGQREEIDRAMDLGVEDYIVKAYHTPNQIVDKIKDFLSRK